ncbi:MAG: hypothetical protein ACE5F1_00950 [Planctomycetota bacterium]
MFPTLRGWYEVATEREIESEDPVVTRMWFDGRGGTFAPTEIPKQAARELGVKPRMVVEDRGSSCVVFLPVYGDISSSYFRALGPILASSAPKDPEPRFIPKFQRPDTFLTPSQRREANEIERNRRNR